MNLLKQINMQTVIKKIIFFCALLVASVALQAQTPTYLLKITNEVQTGPQDYQFEVFLLQTGTNAFELANLGFGIGFDTSILNGGSPTFTIVSPGSTFSDLNTLQQPTTVAPAGTGVSTGTRNVGGVTYRFMNVMARVNPGVGNGTIINNVDGGCAYPGTRVGLFQLHNSSPFRVNSTCKHVWSTAIGGGTILNTVINAYVGGIAVIVNVASSNQSYMAGQTPATCTQNIVLNPATSVEENNFSRDVSVYPNPSNDQFTISGVQPGNRLEIYNMTGEKVCDLKLNDQKETFSHSLNPGIYFLTVTDGKNMYRNKLIVQ